jgi:hypothetical protein
VSGKKKPLGRTQRRIILAFEVYHRQHGETPLWREVRVPLGLRPGEFGTRMQQLRRQGLVTFTVEPRSTRVTPEGLAAAVNGRGPRPV